MVKIDICKTKKVVAAKPTYCRHSPSISNKQIRSRTFKFEIWNWKRERYELTRGEDGEIEADEDGKEGVFVFQSPSEQRHKWEFINHFILFYI